MAWTASIAASLAAASTWAVSTTPGVTQSPGSFHISDSSKLHHVVVRSSRRRRRRLRPKRRKTSHLVLCSASTSKVSQDSRSPGDIGASSKTGGPFPATFSPFANTKPRVGACIHECQRCNSISSDFFQPCPAVAVGDDNHTSIAARVSSSESGHRCEYTSSVSMADAWPRRACTVFTLSPAWINADA